MMSLYRQTETDSLGLLLSLAGVMTKQQMTEQKYYCLRVLTGFNRITRNSDDFAVLLNKYDEAFTLRQFKEPS